MILTYNEDEIYVFWCISIMTTDLRKTHVLQKHSCSENMSNNEKLSVYLPTLAYHVRENLSVVTKSDLYNNKIDVPP